MAPPLPGAGFLTVENMLEDCSYSMIQPWVNTTVPAGGIAAGAQTVDVFDPSMYVGRNWWWEPTDQPITRW